MAPVAKRRKRLKRLIYSDSDPEFNALLNNTLEDGRWKDSFDKFVDERENLRKRKLIKKKIRVSLNRDSSYENSIPSLTIPSDSSTFDNQPVELIHEISTMDGNKSQMHNEVNIHNNGVADEATPFTPIRTDDCQIIPASSTKVSRIPIPIELERYRMGISNKPIPTSGKQIGYISTPNSNCYVIPYFHGSPIRHKFRLFNRSDFSQSSRSICLKSTMEQRMAGIQSTTSIHQPKISKICSVIDLVSDSDVSMNQSNEQSVRLLNSKDNADIDLPKTEIDKDVIDLSIIEVNDGLSPVQEAIETSTQNGYVKSTSKSLISIEPRSILRDLDPKKLENEKNVINDSNDQSFTPQIVQTRKSNRLKRTILPEVDRIEPTVNLKSHSKSKVDNTENVGSFEGFQSIENELVAKKNNNLQKRPIRPYETRLTNYVQLEKKPQEPLDTKTRKTTAFNSIVDEKQTGNERPILPGGKWRRSIAVYRKKTVQLPKEIHLSSISESEPVDDSSILLLDDTINKSTKPPINRDKFSQMCRNRRSIPAFRITEHINITDSLLDHSEIMNEDDLKSVVLKRCQQTEPEPFDRVYSTKFQKSCRKIGEGVYGEVFMNESRQIVLKIIPIEGSYSVNGEPQKKFDEILSEIVIAMELSELRTCKNNSTNGFVELKRSRCVRGQYPEHFIKLWEEYNERKESENDHPNVFVDNQLYIILELAFAGTDLEAFNFIDAKQSYSAFQQTALTLAIAESEYEFEHRDLHWGNILLTKTDNDYETFILNGRTIEIPTNGVKTTIIDFTLSRMMHSGCCLFNDLSKDDELFAAIGDYQFDIYRMMRKSLTNCWHQFNPFTNVLWLHYTLDKLIKGARYQRPNSRKHRNVIRDMKTLSGDFLQYESAQTVVAKMKIF